jgi:hypothetical protein
MSAGGLFNNEDEGFFLKKAESILRIPEGVVARRASGDR